MTCQDSETITESHMCSIPYKSLVNVQIDHPIAFHDKLLSILELHHENQKLGSPIYYNKWLCPVTGLHVIKR